MNISPSLMMPLLMFVLVSEVLQFTFAESRLRNLTLIDEKYQRENATEKCKEINESLFTVYDQKDLDVVRKISKKGSASVSTWLGMKKTSRNITWLNGSPINESEFPILGTQQKCVAIKQRERQYFNCSERTYFLCENGSTYHLIKKKRNWCQALQHCRTHFTDLASNNKTELDKDEYENETFWVGLMLDGWEWHDQSCSTFRDINTERLLGDEECSAISAVETKMKLQTCDQDFKSLCSNGSVRIQIVDDMDLTWEEALDYCVDKHSHLLRILGAEDQEMVKLWLQHSNTTGHRFWIGLRQSSVFGFWIWQDRVVNWSSWKDGETPDLLRSKHCGVINRDDFMWSAEDCRLKLPFICEEDIVKFKKVEG